VQFAGTGEAAEAHRWLGDRALANGWFERALVEFEQAAALQPALAREMMPRMRLAAALLGREVGAKVTQPVQFGETSLDAAQYEALVAEMRGRASVDLRPAENGHRWNETSTIPPLATFKAETRSRLDGHVGDKPAEEVGRRTNQFRVPWPDRQTAVVVEENTMYVSNRFQVAAYSLADGKRQWRTEPPASPAQRSQEWACIAMRPLVTSRRIYSRMLYTSNPLLVSIEKQGGRTIWTSQLGDREFFVSDPIIVRGQLGLLSIALQESQEGLLRWNLVDAETGELQSQHDLIRLRNTWGARGCCQVACWNDSLIAVLGGVTLRFEPTGELRWVRKEVTIPAEEEPRWILQTYQPPLVDGDRVYITQPGVRAIECLDLATGTRRWQVISPEVIGLVGRSQDRLIVRTEQGLEAIHRDDGRSLWRRAASDLHCCQLATDETVLYAAREPVAGKPNQWQTRLVWLDAASGAEQGSSIVPQFTHDDPKMGPLVAHKDRLWTFFGRGQHDPNRDVVELIPTDLAEKK
jgi:outer membrane protein assembly factor BamB